MREQLAQATRDIIGDPVFVVSVRVRNVSRAITPKPSDGIAIIIGSMLPSRSMSVAVETISPFSHQFHWQPYTPCKSNSSGKRCERFEFCGGVNSKTSPRCAESVAAKVQEAKIFVSRQRTRKLSVGKLFCHRDYTFPDSSGIGAEKSGIVAQVAPRRSCTLPQGVQACPFT